MGICYDCGAEATHYAPEMYGRAESPRPANLLCEVHAKQHSIEEGEPVLSLSAAGIASGTAEHLPYCESCEADRLWETDGIQPVWASPTHACTSGDGQVS